MKTMKRFMAVTLAVGSVFLSATALFAWDNPRTVDWQRPAYAYPPDARYNTDGNNDDVHSIEDRLQRQEERIEAGVELGHLTSREEYFLRGQLARIEAAERYFLRDGHLDKAELTRLHAMLDRNSTFIYRARHNDWNRYGRVAMDGHRHRFGY
jgi:hypothetical protein